MATKKNNNNQKKSADASAEAKTLWNRIKGVVHEGNIRKLTVTAKDGTVVAQCPVTFCVIGVLVSPALAVIALITILVAECGVTVYRKQ